MRVENATIYSVVLTPEFLEDLDKTPQDIKRKVIKTINKIKEHRGFLPAFKPHRSSTVESIWIGHLNKNKAAWRILFEIEDDSTNPIAITFIKLSRHSEMDKFLKEMAK